jgi:hypothetical protein
MPFFSLRYVAALAVAVSMHVSTAMAAATDYKISLVSTVYPEGAGAMLEVRLTDTRTDAPVEGAIIFATRMDMAPDGMATITSLVEVLPSTEPGIYRFSTDLVMAGNWRFSIAAKVQGELETIQAQITIEAQP